MRPLNSLASALRYLPVDREWGRLVTLDGSLVPFTGALDCLMGLSCLAQGDNAEAPCRTRTPSENEWGYRRTP